MGFYRIASGSASVAIRRGGMCLVGGEQIESCTGFILHSCDIFFHTTTVVALVGWSVCSDMLFAKVAVVGI